METSKICARPFYHFEINPGGDVFPCCPAYCNNYSLGNLLRQNLEEIWYGERAESLRNQLKSGNYSQCNLEICLHKEPLSTQQIQNNYYRNGSLKLPARIVASYDLECNLACRICRAAPHRNTSIDLARLERIEGNYFAHLGGCRTMSMSGSGDPFGSAYARRLIGRIACSWPSIKFDFITNGQMLTPRLYFKLGLANRIANLSVSVHAATASTYRKITRNGVFERLLRHLAFYSELKKNGEIPGLRFNFVVCGSNFLDMPAFAELAAAHGATAIFTRYRNQKWESFAKEYANEAPWLKQHPHHDEFIKTLAHKNLRNDNCAFEGYLQRLIKGTSMA